MGGPMREDMTTEELLMEAAYLRLFQSDANAARADQDDGERDGDE